MTLRQAEVRPSGELRLRVIRAEDDEVYRIPRSRKPRRVSIRQLVRDGFPRFGLTREVNAWRLRNCWRLVAPIMRVIAVQRFAGAALVSQLRVTLVQDGRRVELGLASMKVVTTAGVNFLVDALQGTTEPELFNFHGFGTGTTAEAVGDTALVTELTTQYVSDSTRPTGAQGEGASANIYETVATLSPDSGGTIAVTEHGVFSDADVGQGTLLDRSVFSAVNVVAGSDSLEATFSLTLTAGS